MRLQRPESRADSSCRNRTGVTRTEVAVAVLVLLALVGMSFPWLLEAREISRQNTCATRMSNLTRALVDYEQRTGHFPPAAKWSTSSMRSLALHESRRWDLFIEANWAIELLPGVGRDDLHDQFDDSTSVGADENRPLREAFLPEMTCPSDEFNHEENMFVYEPVQGLVREFARGNYAINAGTHSFYTSEGSTKTPTGDHARLHMDGDQREFQYWGNGIAGFNKTFRSDELVNGTSTLVAFNEIRAGIDPIDIRGCWALGHIAASATWGHGINGDAYCPNPRRARSDDIQGGPALNEKYGSEQLIEMGMPCVSYIDKNQNAASRSRHPGGVNTAFLDGSVRFVSNHIDPSVWHYLHSRETPRNAFHREVTELVDWPGSTTEAAPPRTGGKTVSAKRLTNSLGMEFARIPAGEFVMGVPDLRNDHDTPPETPPHPVRITDDYLLGTTEVTLGQYQSVMAPLKPVPEGQNDIPVVDVTWFEAATFCKRLSALPSEKAAGRRYRLPTEAEWEYACREATSEPYDWPVNRAEHDHSGDAAGIEPPLPLTPVSSYSPNGLGLYDMRGNAWEWCADWFDRDYYTRSRLESPAGPDFGYARVIRGGDWIYVGEGCFINYPVLAPWKSSPYVGFRVVCVPAGAD
ncbi:Serine/threonine-protein kinase pkn1 [Maioricimonas rarisocia]|uniref:Serine/threonine-protein kinase pkn1 n=1 Tax=Maioricimonas rarisocia TaxID=2528026 RepID=A0A517Z4R9_9PLAN|nr:SUMF1/EgtB/PvdO family nonheme iron enzyme [Maioricimonas rarisocia]QDU37463.1 Serine/threonine-protein kinase pkn1 [Maioricimonas rarisocia]